MSFALVNFLFDILIALINQFTFSYFLVYCMLLLQNIKHLIIIDDNRISFASIRQYFFCSFINLIIRDVLITCSMVIFNNMDSINLC